MVSATFCALCICAAQAVYSYWHVQSEFELAVQQIGETSVPLLSVSVWDIEPEAIRRQLGVIANRPEIGFARLTATTGQIFVAGNGALLTRATPRVFEIPPPNKTTGSIGRLDVIGNPDALYRELAYALGVSLPGYGVLTLFICALVARVLKQELEQPLRQVASFVTTLAPGNLTTPINLNRRTGRRRDEIDLVVEGFAVLQEGINDHIENLDQLVARRTTELESALSAIRRLSNEDPLTGCCNRRLFNERMPQEIERAARYGRALSVIFCDIDHFKQINDVHGHAAGDAALQAVAACLRGALRADVDWVARYGGEEFVIVLPETGLTEAVATAGRLRVAIGKLPLAQGDAPFSITASFGAAQHLDGTSEQSLLGRADAELYKAKQAGRNRVFPEVAGESAADMHGAG